MKLRNPSIALLAAGALFLIPAAWAQKTELTAEDVVARHLESLGPAERRAALRTRLAMGSAQVKVSMDNVFEQAGEAYLFSQSPKLRVALRFTNPQYTGESLAFDGQKSATGQFVSGRRSTIALFFDLFGQLVKEGLPAGSLSGSWALLRLQELQPRLEYAGVRKVGDEEFHVLRYAPKKTADARIELCFDVQNFRHLRTIYKARFDVPQSAVFSGISPTFPLGPTIMGMPNQGQEITLEEIFSEFQTVDGVTLPTRWVVRATVVARTEAAYTVNMNAGTNKPLVWEWRIQLNRVAHNEAIDPNFFVLQP